MWGAFERAALRKVPSGRVLRSTGHFPGMSGPVLAFLLRVCYPEYVTTAMEIPPWHPPDSSRPHISLSLLLPAPILSSLFRFL